MRAAFAFAVLLASPAAAAEPPSNEAFVRALNAQPGVAILHAGEGRQSYTEWRKSGVSYRLEGQGTEATLVGDDESGAGAVICSWMIYNAARDGLGDCTIDRFPALRADLDRDIPAIETFIVANSVVPVTVEDLRAEAKAQRARTAASRSPSQPRSCAAGDAGALIEALDAMGSEGRRATVDKLLATPRWPVLNPCL